MKDNKIIATFMDQSFKSIDFDPNVAIQNGKYHFSWDWLMPVVEKIESLNAHVELQKDCIILYVGNGTKEKPQFICHHYKSNKFVNLYNACVSFITWYTSKKH